MTNFRIGETVEVTLAPRYDTLPASVEACVGPVGTRHVLAPSLWGRPGVDEVAVEFMPDWFRAVA